MDVLSWAQSAEPGTRVVYAWRAADDYLPMGQTPRLASAHRAHRAGLVFLAQRRTANGFDYEATRISEGVARKLQLGEFDPNRVLWEDC